MRAHLFTLKRLYSRYMEAGYLTNDIIAELNGKGLDVSAVRHEFQQMANKGVLA